MKQYGVPVVYPPEETVKELAAVFRDNPEQFRAASIRPPAERLQALAGWLDSPAFDLINPPLGSAEALNAGHAPVHLLGDSGPAFQLVSFNDGYSGPAGIDEWLRDPEAWGKQALALGGIIDYGLDGRGYFTGQPGVLAVLLRYDGAGLTFELWSDSGGVRPGTAVLLERYAAAPQPYTFFLPDHLCFSQRQMQARLEVEVPVDELALSAAEASTRALIAVGLLPKGADAEFVNLNSARATVLGASDDPLSSGPDVIVAAARPFARQPAGNMGVTCGQAVLRVTRSIAGLAATPDGEPAGIEAGDYRLDILELGEDLVGQLVAGPEAEYFLPLRAGQLEGEPYPFKAPSQAPSKAQDEGAPDPTGAQDDGAEPLVAVGTIHLFSYCTTTQIQNAPACTNWLGHAGSLVTVSIG